MNKKALKLRKEKKRLQVQIIRQRNNWKPGNAMVIGKDRY